MTNSALGSLRPQRGAKDIFCVFKELDKTITHDNQIVWAICNKELQGMGQTSRTLGRLKMKLRGKH